jgi:hypothetical protein
VVIPFVRLCMRIRLPSDAWMLMVGVPHHVARSAKRRRPTRWLPQWVIMLMYVCGIKFTRFGGRGVRKEEKNLASSSNSPSTSLSIVTLTHSRP